MKKLAQFISLILATMSFSVISQAATVFPDSFAQGDGSASNPWTSASGCAGIVEAFAQLPPTGGTLTMRAGHYKITNPRGCMLSGKSFTWTGAGAGQSIIDASELKVNVVAITVQGALEELPATTARPLRMGDTSVEFTAPLNVQPSDWLLIRSKTELWSNVRPYYFKGEWQQVKSIAGTRVTTGLPIWDSYRANTNVSVLHPIQVDISGFEIDGNRDLQNGMAGFVLKYTLNSSMHDVRINQCNERAWGIYYAVNFKFFNNSGEEVYAKVPIGRNYGVMLAMHFNTEVYGNHLSAGRHAIALGGDSDGGVDRNVDVHDNDISGGEAERVLDAHGIAEHYHYHHNRIHGGIVVGGQYGDITDNYVTINVLRGEVIGLAETKSWNFNITGNTFVVDKAPSVNKGLIKLDNPKSADGGGKLVIANNQISVPNGISIPILMTLLPPAGDRIDEVDVVGNTFENGNPLSPQKTSADAENIIIGVNAPATGVGKIVIKNNVLKHVQMKVVALGHGTIGPVASDTNTINGSNDSGFSVYGVSDFTSHNDQVYDTNDAGILFQQPLPNARIEISGLQVKNTNRARKPGECSRAHVCKTGDSPANITVTGSTFSGAGSPSQVSSAVYVHSGSSSDRVRQSSNTFSDRSMERVAQR